MGTVKYSGPVASFHCPTEATIRSLKVHFSPKQEGIGDPSPENVREIVGWDGVEVEQSGKNLFNKDDVKLTATNCWMNTTTIAASSTDRVAYISCCPNTTYVIHKLIGNVLAAAYTIDLPAAGVVHYNYMRDNAAKQVTVTTGIDAKYLAVWFYDASKTFDRTVQPEDIYRTLQVEYGSTANSYESYNGSTTNYEFGVLGKNKFDYASTTFIQGIRGNDGEFVSDSVSHYTEQFIPVIPATEYTLSGNNLYSGSYVVRIYYSDANKNWISKTSGDRTNALTFTTPSDCYYIQIQTNSNGTNPDTWQLELGSTATTYEPYDPNKMVYGGWVDLVSGEVCEEYGFLTESSGGTLASVVDHNDGYYSIIFNFDTDKRPYSSRESLCNILNYNSTLTAQNNEYAFYYYLNQQAWKAECRIYSATPLTTVEEAKTYLNQLGFKLAYKIPTPITYHVAPTSLQTFLGHNNVWSNADYIEVEYDLHEIQTILTRKQFIMANQPHIEQASGDIASFETDMAAPLKECKIHFEPVQEGEGDPSPENVRAITGWTGINVNRAGINLIVQDDQENPRKYYTDSSTPGMEYDATEQAFIYRGRGVGYAKHAGVVNRFFIAPNDMTATVSVDYKNVSTTYGIRFYKNGTRITDIHGDKDSIWHRWERTFELLKGDYFSLTIYDGIYFRNWQIKIADSVIEYEPYQGTTLPIDWTDTAGTVYGGYVDLVNGELVEEWYKIVADGVNVKANSKYVNNDLQTYGGGIVYVSPPGNHNHDSLLKTTVLCDILPAIGQSQTDKLIPCLWCARNGQLYVVFNLFPISDFETEPSRQEIIDMTNAWLQEHPTTIVYKLQTPIHHSLTPQTLKTLRGTNNIWSSANGTIETKFWTH